MDKKPQRGTSVIPKKGGLAGSKSKKNGAVAGSAKAFKDFNKESYRMQQRLVKEIREGKISNKEAQAEANVEMARLTKKYKIDPIGPIDTSKTAPTVITKKPKSSVPIIPSKKPKKPKPKVIVSAKDDKAVQAAVQEAIWGTYDPDIAPGAVREALAEVGKADKPPTRKFKETGRMILKDPDLAKKRVVRKEMKRKADLLKAQQEELKRRRVVSDRDRRARERFDRARRDRGFGDGRVDMAAIRGAAEAGMVRDPRTGQLVAAASPRLISRVGRAPMLRQTPEQIAERQRQVEDSRLMREKLAARRGGLYQDSLKGERHLETILKIKHRKKPKEGYAAVDVERAVSRRGMQRNEAGGIRFGHWREITDPLRPSVRVKDESKVRITIDKPRSYADFQMIAPIARYPEGRLDIQREVFSFLRTMNMEPIGNALIEDLVPPRIKEGYMKYYVRIHAKKKKRRD